MKAITKIIFLDDQNEKFFGEGPCQLLREVKRTGSLNAAAGSLGMAYTKALKILRNAEKTLGFPLTRRSVGGRSGGGSTLTQEGLEWLEKYEAYRDACLEANNRLYRKFFSVGETQPDQRIVFPETGLVIMASGLGKRFGSNKLLADFDGEPMIQRILDTSADLFAERVVVTRHLEVVELCEKQNIRVILHDYEGRNDTVRLGLEALETTMGESLKKCIFTPSDQPLLTRNTLKRLAQASETDSENMIRIAWEDQAGTPTAFPAWTFSELKNLPEGKGGNLLLKKYPEKVSQIQAGSPAELRDADTPGDLEELLQIWKT